MSKFLWLAGHFSARFNTPSILTKSGGFYKGQDVWPDGYAADLSAFGATGEVLLSQEKLCHPAAFIQRICQDKTYHKAKAGLSCPHHVQGMGLPPVFPGASELLLHGP